MPIHALLMNQNAQWAQRHVDVHDQPHDHGHWSGVGNKDCQLLPASYREKDSPLLRS